MNPLDAPFEPRALRAALGAFVTGVTVITTQDAAGRLHGLTANSFNTVSLDPPLILWSQAKSSGSHEAFQQAARFAISILAEDQIDISGRFASKLPDKFDGVAVDRDFCPLPVIAGSSAWLHCRTVSQVDGGDHTIYIGEVLRVARGARRPLAFGGGQYLAPQPHHAALATSTVPVGARQRHAVRLCTPAMQQIADELDVTVCAGVWGNLGPTVVGWETGPRPVLPGFPLGLVLPVTGSATGKAFASAMPAETVTPFVERELGDGASPMPKSALSVWASALQQVRETGLAVQEPTRFWNDDMLVSAVSVAVRDRDGLAIAAMTAVVRSPCPASVLEAAGARLRQAADSVEQLLGVEGAARSH